VSLSLANHHASLPVAYRLYLPEDWAEDSKRRRKTGVPEDICFKTKPEIALEQSLVTRRPQYTPFEATEHTNQGRSPPKRHAVQAMATRYSTSLQSSPYERLRYFSVTAAIEDSHAAALMD
jgi:hypothetical protein